MSYKTAQEMADAVMAYSKPSLPLFNIFTTNAAMSSSDNTQSVKTRIKSFFNDDLRIDNRMKTMTENINVICKKLSENQWLFESVEKQKLYLDHLFHFQLAVIGTTIQCVYTKNGLNHILENTKKSIEATQNTFFLRNSPNQMASFPLTHIQKETAKTIKNDINDMLTFMIHFINFKTLPTSEGLFKELLETTLKPILTMPTSTDTKTHVQEFIEKLKKNPFSTLDNLPAYIYLFNLILIALIAADKPNCFLGLTTNEWQSQLAEISPEIYQYFATEGYLHAAEIFSLIRKLRTEIGFYFSDRSPSSSPRISTTNSIAPIPSPIHSSPIHSSPSTPSSSGRSTPTPTSYINEDGLLCFPI